MERIPLIEYANDILRNKLTPFACEFGMEFTQAVLPPFSLSEETEQKLKQLPPEEEKKETARIILATIRQQLRSTLPPTSEKEAPEETWLKKATKLVAEKKESENYHCLIAGLESVTSVFQQLRELSGEQ